MPRGNAAAVSDGRPVQLNTTTPPPASRGAAALARIRATRGEDGTAATRRYFTNEQLLQYRETFHNRQRCTLEEPPLLYQTPILDKRPYVQPLCYAPLLFPCCMDNEYRRAFCGKRTGSIFSSTQTGVLAYPDNEADEMADLRAVTEDDDVDELDEVAVHVHGRRGVPSNGDGAHSTPPENDRGRTDDGSPSTSPRRVLQRPQEGFTAQTDRHGEHTYPPRTRALGHGGRVGVDLGPSLSRGGGPSGSGGEVLTDGCTHLLSRCFCLRCSIAQQTDLLFREEERRQRYPYRFCAEWFFGSQGHYRRTLLTMLVCDLLTGGLFIPCGLSYQGLGTACYGWRTRYLIRCRYGIYSPAICDLFIMLCLPMQAVDQQGMEMAAHGLFEVPGICYNSQML